MAKEGTFSWLPCITLYKFSIRTSNDTTVSKITANYYKIWDMLVVGSMYWAISTAVPFNILPDHRFWVVVLDTLYLMVPLWKNNFVFPGVASLLKVFILGVNLVARVLIRHPMSSSVCGEPVGCGDCLLGPHPPSWEGNLLIFHIGVPTSCQSPSVAQGRASWGHTQLPRHYLLPEVFHELL